MSEKQLSYQIKCAVLLHVLSLSLTNKPRLTCLKGSLDLITKTSIDCAEFNAQLCYCSNINTVIKPHNLQAMGQYEQHKNVVSNSLNYHFAEHKPILKVTNGLALEI